jgi:ABC-type nitrate/sulfonate/bicarbonate transport system ATPase subunit
MRLVSLSLYIERVDLGPVLTLSNTEKTFGVLSAVAPTSFSVEQGSFVSLVGPSGCGKSTLFNMIAGLEAPSAGSVELHGADISGRTGHVGYMLQKDLLAPWRTVLGNITMGAHLTRGVTREDEERGASLAQQYGLGEFLGHYPAALSGGMRQRVALMRTLMTDHELLLLDEPFGALDAQTRFDMQRWLLEVWQSTQRTVLFVTHDVDEAIFLSDRILVMSERPGHIVLDLPIDLPRPRRTAMLTDGAFMEAKREILALLHHETGE